VCYRAPTADVNAFVASLHSLLKSAKHEKYYQICILGDFNFPGITWLDSLTHLTTSAEQEHFCDLLEEYALHQLNNLPSTGHGNVLDLVIASNPDKISAISYCDEDLSSDHFILEFNIDVDRDIPPAQERYVYNYAKADFDALSELIRDARLAQTISDIPDPDKAWSCWYNCIMNIINRCVPRTVIRKSSTPWIDKEVRHARNKRGMQC
jgi:hypothetical protein